MTLTGNRIATRKDAGAKGHAAMGNVISITDGSPASDENTPENIANATWRLQELAPITVAETAELLGICTLDLDSAQP